MNFFWVVGAVAGLILAAVVVFVIWAGILAPGRASAKEEKERARARRKQKAIAKWFAKNRFRATVQDSSTYEIVDGDGEKKGVKRERWANKQIYEAFYMKLQRWLGSNKR